MGRRKSGLQYVNANIGVSTPLDELAQMYVENRLNIDEFEHMIEITLRDMEQHPPGTKFVMIPEQNIRRYLNATSI